jgi:hypothetical protein
MHEKYTPEEIAKFTESRTTNDSKLIDGGAQYVPNEAGEPVLRPTRKQVETIRNSDPRTKREKEQLPKTEILRTFSTPDQTEELNFKEFLKNPLFENSYYLYIPGLGDDFKKRVYEMSEPIRDMKGKAFKEAKVIRKASEKEIIEELGIKPMSINEWKYLFANLTRKELYGRIFYLVQLEDGTIRTIQTEFTTNDPGPYGYSLSFKRISNSTIRAQPFGGGPYTELEPKVIFPAEDTENK